ncbi:MAG: LPS-assembly protein LptD [Kiritimatiellia bacterium]
MKKSSILLPCFFTIFLGIFTPSLSAAENADLQVEADQLSFEAETNEVTATGNVLLRKGSQSLKADVVTYNQVTEQAFARGNVVFTNEDQIWRGETLQYNFITGKGSFPSLNMESGPFKLSAAGLERLGPVQTRMEEVKVTTCPDPVDPEFEIRAGVVDVYEDEVFLMRNPVFYLHGIPFFYLPRLTLDQRRQPTNFDVIPGYSSRDGFSLLNSYNRYPTDGYRTKTHLDLRSERGLAAGQDFYWYDPESNRDHTVLKFYGALDDAPYRNADQETALRAQGIDIDEERYRIKFNTRREISPTDTVWANASYLSDAKVVEDFFEDEFRDEPVPETRVAYSALGEGWNANIDLSRQLNPEEFESVNRLPEATFNVPLLKMGESDFLYESETRAGYLERSYSDFQKESGLENYDSLRLHTEQMFYYPTRHFGWLNLIPRAGASVTYYDTTRRTEEVVTPVSIVDENNIITTSFETNRVTTAQSADIRVLPEIGFETSFKAFGIVHDRATNLGSGLRHVVEPFANYTFVPEPDLTPSQIYQFDEIDALGEEHNLAFGVRNKWQTKRPIGNDRYQIQDMVNMVISTSYDLRSEADPSLADIFVDTEMRLVDWAWTRFNFRYDSEESEFNAANVELRLKDAQTGNSLILNHRYRLDDTNTLQLEYELNPKERFGFTGYTRYEFEDAGFEEQEVMFTIRTDCVGYGIGGKWRKGDTYLDGTSDDDDYEIWFQFWLTAFPRAILGTR